MIIKEAKIMIANRGKYKDLSIRFLVKPEDYSMEEYELLCDQAIDGVCGALVWQPFGEKVAPPKSKALANFRMNMIREFGEPAYRELKKKLGIEHLRDLQATKTEAEIETLLADELHNMRVQAGFFDN
jgi:hypothetical protein